MPAVKNHYNTLHVPYTAGQTEIKKAYRRLAVKYHPDKNPTDPFAENYFKEIQEAYSILSHPGKRRVYDRELWLSGTNLRNTAQTDLSPATFIMKCKQLHHHVMRGNTAMVDKAVLYAYIQQLLSDSQVSALQDDATQEQQLAILNEILPLGQHLHQADFTQLLARLQQFTGQDSRTQAFMEQYRLKWGAQARWDKWMPWVMVALTLLFMGLMYWYVKG
jgi:curved DNA-binding protein CbpA